MSLPFHSILKYQEIIGFSKKNQRPFYLSAAHDRNPMAERTPEDSPPGFFRSRFGRIIIDGFYEWAVGAVLDFNFVERELHYHVRWVGYEDTTWEPAAHLTNALEQVADYYRRRGERDADERRVGEARVGQDLRAFVRRAEDGLRRTERRLRRKR